jgi:hypothetical protein
MPISLNSLRSSSALKPPRFIVYGPHGLGKTTLAAGMPDPVFMQTEDGLADPGLDVPTFGILSTYGDVRDALYSLYQEPHSFKNVVLDTLDHLEPIVWAEACARNGWGTIEDAGYGKGYDEALNVWRELLAGFDALRNDRGMGVAFLAHAAVKKFNAPDTEPYDRYRIKLHESNQGRGAAPLLQEHVDCVFFINFRVTVLRDKPAGAGKKVEGRARGVGAGQRVIYTEDRPAFEAKNRYRMPDSITLPDDPGGAWPALAEHIPYYRALASVPEQQTAE